MGKRKLHKKKIVQIKNLKENPDVSESDDYSQDEQ